MTDPGPESLARWMRFLATEDCPCPYQWKGIGVLYGVSMGKGWIRMDTVPECRHHGDAAMSGAPLGSQ